LHYRVRWRCPVEPALWAAWGLALLLMAVHLAAIFGLVVAAEMVAILTYR